MTSLDELAPIYREALEEQMRKVVDKISGPGLDDLHYMLVYHLGWEGPGSGPEARGKRIRPLLCLLVAVACGGEWRVALPAAAGVELVHNFSLIHDDVEDKSHLRRGRETLWSHWGVPLAVNAGDAVFSLAFLSVLEMEDINIAHQAALVLQRTCLHLTQGQHLDISYESSSILSLDDYWAMINGKTAALIAACCEIGALSSGANEAQCQAYNRFGHLLGLAFQVQDDYLGIWGNTDLTGKSVSSDLVSGKKSLPILYGLSLGGLFAKRWTTGNITDEEAPPLANQLEIEGARQYTLERASALTDQALQALEQAKPLAKAGEALIQLTRQLLRRNY